MGFDRIKGQNLAVQYLKNSISNNCISHAYLFSGPKGVGKMKTALAFAQSLNCLDVAYFGDSCNKCISCRKVLNSNHPDITVIMPDGLSIKIEQVRDVRSKAYFKNYESKYKVIIFEEAHLMTTQGANSLLKTLEEPPLDTLFILITSEPQQLLETIISRCQQIQFNYLSTEGVVTILEELYPDNRQAQAIARLAKGSLGKAIEMLDQDSKVLSTRAEVLNNLQGISHIPTHQLVTWTSKWDRDKEGVRSFLEIAQLWYRDQMVWKVTGEESLIINQDYLGHIKEGKYTLEKISKTLELLHEGFVALKYNVNPRLVLDLFLLRLKEN